MDEESTNKAIIKFGWLKFENHILTKSFYYDQIFSLQ